MVRIFMLIIKMMTLTVIMTTINVQLSKLVTIFSNYNQDRMMMTFTVMMSGSSNNCDPDQNPHNLFFYSFCNQDRSPHCPMWISSKQMQVIKYFSFIMLSLLLLSLSSLSLSWFSLFIQIIIAINDYKKTTGTFLQPVPSTMLSTPSSTSSRT